jgi:hypothetical protein
MGRTGRTGILIGSIGSGFRANFDLDFELDDYQFSKEEQLMLKHERRGAGRIIDGKQNKSVRDKGKDIHTEKFS